MPTLDYDPLQVLDETIQDRLIASLDHADQSTTRLFQLLLTVLATLNMLVIVVAGCMVPGGRGVAGSWWAQLLCTQLIIVRIQLPHIHDRIRAVGTIMATVVGALGMWSLLMHGDYLAVGLAASTVGLFWAAGTLEQETSKGRASVDGLRRHRYKYKGA